MGKMKSTLLDFKKNTAKNRKFAFSHLLKSPPVVILSYFASHEVLITFFTGLYTVALTQHSQGRTRHVEIYS